MVAEGKQVELKEQEDSRSAMDAVFDGIGWVRIALSPTLIGVVAGGIAYLFLRGGLGIAIWVAAALCGLLAGVWFAERVRRKTSPMTFVARVDASPDLDKLERNDETDTTKS